MLNNNYKITHAGACNQCSSLNDLKEYITKPNQTDPFTKCTTKSLAFKFSPLSMLPPPLGLTDDEQNKLRTSYVKECIKDPVENGSCNSREYAEELADPPAQQIPPRNPKCVSFSYTPECSDIWAWNTLNTDDKCGLSEGTDGCIPAKFTCPNNLDSIQNTKNQINKCLQCDEINSGPGFKHYAGRTRRGSGLPSSICRDCSSIVPITHNYLSPPPTAEEQRIHNARKACDKCTNNLTCDQCTGLLFTLNNPATGRSPGEKEAVCNLISDNFCNLSSEQDAYTQFIRLYGNNAAVGNNCKTLDGFGNFDFDDTGIYLRGQSECPVIIGGG